MACGYTVSAQYVCVCVSLPHLFESGRGHRPALVQHVLRQVPVQRHEEGVAHIVQEVLVLGTALLVAVDEALDEPVQLEE